MFRHEVLCQLQSTRWHLIKEKGDIRWSDEYCYVVEKWPWIKIKIQMKFNYNKTEGRHNHKFLSWARLIHSIAILAEDLVYNTVLFLLWHSWFYSCYDLTQGDCCGKDIADIEGSTQLLKSLTESTDVRSVQSSLWFGELQVFSKWHEAVSVFWPGGWENHLLGKPHLDVVTLSVTDSKGSIPHTSHNPSFL